MHIHYTFSSPLGKSVLFLTHLLHIARIFINEVIPMLRFHYIVLTSVNSYHLTTNIHTNRSYLHLLYIHKINNKQIHHEIYRIGVTSQHTVSMTKFIHQYQIQQLVNTTFYFSCSFTGFIILVTVHIYIIGFLISLNIYASIS